jgi:hypothetical protein
MDPFLTSGPVGIALADLHGRRGTREMLGLCAPRSDRVTSSLPSPAGGRAPHPLDSAFRRTASSGSPLDVTGRFETWWF